MAAHSASPHSAIVFGASGKIGSVLLAQMKQQGWFVSGTYARRARPGLVRCDLAESDPLDGIDLGQYRIGVILSAVAEVDQCKRDPQTAARINVDGTRRLLAALAANGVTPVFFSTDYVFDGAKGNYTETDPPSPNTEYGRQKAAIESHLHESFPQALVVRISKVFSTDPADGMLLSEWYRMVQRNETIRTISDQRTCPTSIHDITTGLLQLLEQVRTGLFNLCQPKPYTRGELLREFLDTLRIPYDNVVEMEARRFGFLDQRPADISLNPSKFLQFTGFRFTPMDELFRQFQRRVRGGES